MKVLQFRRGFTLIELLVVLTILGLLAAMLFPVFAKVRENGRRTVCLSNERQLGIAMMQYTDDNDGLWHEWAWEKVSETGWAHDAAYPYVQSAASFRCPDDPSPDYVRATPLFPALKPATPNSYAINSNLDDLRDADIVAPTKTVMLFEVRNCQETFTESHRYATGSMAGNGYKALNCDVHGCADEDAQYDTGDIGARFVNLDKSGRPGRHGGGADYVACDGHVVWLRPEAVSGGQSQPAGGASCGQDDTAPACGGTNMAAGTASAKYRLTFSVR